MLKKKNKKPNLILSAYERDAMRQAGQVNAALMDFLRPQITAGVTTEQIDRWVYDWTIQNGHKPATLGYQNSYHKSCCTSVNDVICHGIPGPYALQEGDIVNIDIATIVEGWHGDQSETFLIGTVSPEALAVTQCALDCLYLAIAALEPGCMVSKIGETIVPEAHGRGCTVVREYVGHGLGRLFHQDPSIPHFPNRQSRTDRLLPGIAFTVEPMINGGCRYTRLDRGDGWTVRTKDGSLSAQFEHTVLMTEDGPEILTPTQLGPKMGHVFRNPVALSPSVATNS